MTRIHRLPVILALLPLACGDSGADDEGATADSSTLTETGTSVTDSAETGTASGDGDGDMSGDGDGDPATGDGDGDMSGDGDGDTSGDGDGDMSGDGDGDMSGDGDGDMSGDGDGDMSGDGDGDDPPPCVDFEVTVEPIPPNVMIVLDKSGSMFGNSWDHDNDNGTPQITRWNSLYQVVDNIVTTFDQQINFGANLFPSVQAQNVYGPAACITNDIPEVNVNPGNGAAILATIPGPNVVDSFGGTPAYLGIETAYAHLQSLDPTNPPVMILVTDGAANCDQSAQDNFELFEVYDDNLQVIVGQAFDDGIPTYVVGIDIADMVINDGVGGDPNNINPSDELNAVAAAGGTGQFFNSQDQGQLEAALTDVVENVQTCIIPLDEEPFFPEYTKVIVDNVEYDMVMDCQSEDGWVYTNPNGPYDAIELCGAACDALGNTGEADVQYFCNPG